MKEVVFVIGPPNCGKSYFIKNYLQDYYVVDLLQFQQKIPPVSIEAIQRSYDECEKALKQACQEYDKVVLEHTLLLAKRRTRYIDAVKEILGKSIKITCYYSLPTLNDAIKYDELDAKQYLSSHPNRSLRATTAPKEDIEKALNMFELPTKEQGFDKIINIQKQLGTNNYNPN